MNSSLKLDWCSFKAAKYACEQWHYSKCLPAGKLIKVGVWENEIFIGVVIFSRGANPHLLEPYGLDQTQGCELTRIALNKHETPVTRIVSIALNLLKKYCPGLELVVSYADANQGHLGRIYQAGNWVYEGEFANERGIMINGRLMHRRSVVNRFKTSSMKYLIENIDKNAHKVMGLSKFKYLMPLNRVIKSKIEKLRKPYPKIICPGDVTGNMAEFHSETGSSNLTSGLKTTKNP